MAKVTAVLVPTSPPQKRPHRLVPPASAAAALQAPSLPRFLAQNQGPRMARPEHWRLGGQSGRCSREAAAVRRSPPLLAPAAAALHRRSLAQTAAESSRARAALPSRLPRSSRARAQWPCARRVPVTRSRRWRRHLQNRPMASGSRACWPRSPRRRPSNATGSAFLKRRRPRAGTFYGRDHAKASALQSLRPQSPPRPP